MLLDRVFSIGHFEGSDQSRYGGSSCLGRDFLSGWRRQNCRPWLSDKSFRQSTTRLARRSLMLNLKEEDIELKVMVLMIMSALYSCKLADRKTGEPTRKGA